MGWSCCGQWKGVGLPTSSSSGAAVPSWRTSSGARVLFSSRSDGAMVTTFVKPNMPGAGAMEMPKTFFCVHALALSIVSVVVPVVPTAPMPSFPLHCDSLVLKKNEALPALPALPALSVT